MTDPRNVAHDKKVQQEKKHHHEEVVAGAAEKPKPGKKPPLSEEAKAHSVEFPDDPPGSDA